MPRTLRYLTHPQVNIDPGVPVPEWGLSDIGRARTVAICGSPSLAATKHIVSSAERKALETAAIVAEFLRVDVQVREKMHENDRSATGFLEPSQFETVADHFFAEPDRSIRGWERAIDAQSRIVKEVAKILTALQSGDILLVGHGGVGTLLYCHFAKEPIARSFDQPAGGGCYFSFDLDSGQILHPWKTMEELS